MTAGRWGRSMAVAGAAVLLAVPTACERAAHPSGDSVSPCFRVLPAATGALGGQGHLVGVTRRRGTKAETFRAVRPGTSGVRSGVASTTAAARPSSTATGTSGATIDHDVCVLTFRGPFQADRIPGLDPIFRSGRYAVVVVGASSRLVRSIVLTDAPATRHH